MTNKKPAAEAATSFDASVRDSRAGDQFHYVWAATEALHLLDRRVGLQEIWIERSPGSPGTGDEVIDVAECFGPTSDRIERVSVVQLKYSTKRRSTSLGFGELGEALAKFGRLDSRSSSDFKLPTDASVNYVILSNRPFGVQFRRALEKIIAGNLGRPNSRARTVLGLIGLPLAEAASLCRRLELRSDPWTLPALRAALDETTVDLTGGLDPGTASLLVEAVTLRASGVVDGPIRPEDIAAVFRLRLKDLLPAPSLLSPVPAVVQRTNWSDLANEIMASEEQVVVTAVGGMGKSTFAAELPRLLHDRAAVVVYDCFGGGSYRAVDTVRHRHRDGLVQIVSELSGLGLCGPLIPHVSTDATEYIKTFRYRLIEAASSLRLLDPPRDLVIVIDAADNAVMAGKERAEPNFVRDILQMTPVTGVHIVATSRPERSLLLEANTSSPVLALAPFSAEESGNLLRATYPSARTDEVLEFHQRTSGNPRAQAFALDVTQSLPACLQMLAGMPVGDVDSLSRLLETQLEKALGRAGERRKNLEFVAQLLAVLRPPIPIDVLAALADCSEDEISSFVSDLGRGLLLDEAGLRFLDEPTETFFRGRYPLGVPEAERIAAVLRAQSPDSVYAATVLPQILWGARRFRELIDLALSDASLPETGEIERRQVAKLRSEYALRAAITLVEPASITQLAVVAGSAAASMERRYTLLRDEPDLAGKLLDAPTLDDIRASGALPSPWPGASLSAEAAMLSMNSNRQGEARSRLRAAEQAMYAWGNQQRASDRRLEPITPRQVAAVALTRYQLDGAARAAQFLAAWRPDRWIVQCTTEFARTLLARADRGGIDALLDATRSLAVAVATAGEMQRIGAPLPPRLAKRLWRLLETQRLVVDRDEVIIGDQRDTTDRGIAWICAAAIRHGIAQPEAAVTLVQQRLPARPPLGLGERGRSDTGLLLLYALEAHLRGTDLTTTDFDFRTHGTDAHQTSMRQEARERLAPLLPWANGWAEWSTSGLDTSAAVALLQSFPSRSYDQGSVVVLRRFAGPLAMQIAAASSDDFLLDLAKDLLAKAVERSGLYVAADMLACLHGDERFADVAYACAEEAGAQAGDGTSSADEATDALIRIARGVWAFDASEGLAYAQRALTIASGLGDDAWQRWQAVVAVADSARTTASTEGAYLAARVGRVAELISSHLNDEVAEHMLVPALSKIAGPMAFGLVSQWRSRLFGSTNWQISLLCEGLSLARERPMIAAGLAACADRIALDPVITQLEAAGQMTTERREAIQALAWARGEGLLAGPATSASGEADEVLLVESDEDWEKEKRLREQQIAEDLALLHLDQAAGMEAAARFLRRPHDLSIRPLVASIKALPLNRHAAAIRQFAQCPLFDQTQRGQFISLAADELVGPGAARRLALREVATDYLATYGTELVSGSSYGFDAAKVAAVLQVTVREVLLRALRASDPSVAVSTSSRCYRLAAQAAAMTEPREAVVALERGLTQLEADLGAPSWSGHLVSVPDVCTVEEATAGFIWAMLADPTIEMRWRARHAVRLLATCGAVKVMRALARIVEDGTPAGYTDPRFPFYELHAAESLLVALERVSLTAPRAIGSMQGTVMTLEQRYPDHWRIQQSCAHIRIRTAGKQWPPRATNEGNDQSFIPDIIVAPPYHRPNIPKPYAKGAVKTEYRFPFDVDEYWFADLTRCFDVTHEEVLQSASDLILDEWNWRGSEALKADPRRLAGAYADQQTWIRHSEFPQVDDLDFYLSYHAMMTLAGRLSRKYAWLQDSQDTTPNFERWQRRFDLARGDGFWVVDGRRPMPDGIGHGSIESADWLCDVRASDFERVVVNGNGEVTTAMSATNEQSSMIDRVTVRSWLVDPASGPALLRAVQTSASLNSDGIPYADDADTPIYDQAPFRLEPWVSFTHSEGGDDRRDELAAHLQSPLPVPSTRVRRLLGLTSDGPGTWWSTEEYDGVGIAVTTWSEKERSGRNLNGATGYRAVTTQKFLDHLLAKTGEALIVEVRFARNDYSSSPLRWHEEDSLGPVDDYIRFFSYTPSAGWRDYRGTPVSRQVDSHRS